MVQQSKRRSPLRSRVSKAGLPPGTLIHTDTPKHTKTDIKITIYGPTEHIEHNNINYDQAIPLIKSAIEEKKKLWINLDGLGDLDAIRHFGEYFNIHPLVLEDITTPFQRPKAEHYDHYSFLVIRSSLSRDTNNLETEQISMIIGESVLITVQEKPGGCFSKTPERIKPQNSRIRSNGVDYLAYTILDLIVDDYFSILELYGEKLQELEEEVVTSPTQLALRKLYHYKRSALELRRTVWPVRELLSNLERSDSQFFAATTKVYLRDVYSHVIELVDTLEIYREMLSGLLDVYLTSVSNKLNQVMKVLTIITTIFMPLTFIAGIYGMNFQHMPELSWHFGYPIVLVVMLFIALAMLLFFRKKQWL